MRKTAISSKKERTWVSGFVVNSLLVISSIAITLIGLESLYRIRVYQRGDFGTYRVAAVAQGVYDKEFGIKYEPNSEWTMFTIKNGKVTWCPETLGILNKDGLPGKTTIEEYNNADIKILAFGDSFTYRSQNGYTWPDLLQENLAKSLGVNVSILNYGHSGYGILQMFDIAEAKIKQHQPDLVLFGFITHDLTRERWWTKTVDIGEYTRSLFSPNKDDFSLKIASDMPYIVNPSVDLAWCQKSLGSSESNPVLDQVNKQYEKIKRSFLKIRGVTEDNIFSFDRSYLFNKIVYGRPFDHLRFGIPRVTINDFGFDKQLVSKIGSIKHSKTPYFLFHLPLQDEIENSKIRANPQRTSLLASLEGLTNKKVIFLFKDIDKEELPEAINLQPHDGHPNFSGIKLYADLMTAHVIKTINSHRTQF